MRRVLITGGAGFIGSHIAEEALKQGLGEVTAFDNLSSGSEDNLKHLGGRVSFVNGDIRDRDALGRAMEGVGVVFHKAAFVSAFDSYNDPVLVNEINIQGTFNVLDAAWKAGVKRVVLASSAAIYGTESELPNCESMLPRPESPYAISKIVNEYHARFFAGYRGLETVCLRYFNVFGPRQDPSSEYSGVMSRFVERISCGEVPIIYGDGEQTRDFIFVGDVARANIMAAMHEGHLSGECINVGTGRETSLLMLIEALKEACGRDIHPEMRSWRDGDIRRSVAAVERARELLGYEAAVDFNSGVKMLLDAVKAEGLC